MSKFLDSYDPSNSLQRDCHPKTVNDKPTTFEFVMLNETKLNNGDKATGRDAVELLTKSCFYHQSWTNGCIAVDD